MTYLKYIVFGVIFLSSLHAGSRDARTTFDLLKKGNSLARVAGDVHAPGIVVENGGFVSGPPVYPRHSQRLGATSMEVSR